MYYQENKPLIERIDASGTVLFYDRDTEELFTGQAITKTRFKDQLFEGSYTDGKLDGISTLRFPNGQKVSEMIYKNGKLISEKGWSQDGSLKTD